VHGRQNNLLAPGAGGFVSRPKAVARQADMKKSDKAMGTKEFLKALSETPLSPFLCLNSVDILRYWHGAQQEPDLRSLD
jgi:hypothetical protein